MNDDDEAWHGVEWGSRVLTDANSILTNEK